MSDNVIVPRELLEYLAELGDEAIQRMGSYLAEKHGEQRYVDAARAILAQPAATLDDRMREAGMLTIDEMLSGAPLDGLIRHAGIHDLETYGQWLDMKCKEYLSMQASRDLDKRDGDDLYEWVLAHAAVFQEARINFNAARRPAPLSQRNEREA